MLQQIAVQAPITFRRSWRRKTDRKIQIYPNKAENYRKHTEEDLPLNLLLSGRLWTQTGSEGGDGEEVRGKGIV